LGPSKGLKTEEIQAEEIQAFEKQDEEVL